MKDHYIVSFVQIVRMHPELYFDISSEEQGGSLFRIIQDGGGYYFRYSHSTYDEQKDEIMVFETRYERFEDFWKKIKENAEWFYLHPLYVHPEQRAFVREELKAVNWAIHSNKKWQDSHQRQWKKVLSDPDDYYQPGR